MNTEPGFTNWATKDRAEITTEAVEAIEASGAEIARADEFDIDAIVDELSATEHPLDEDAFWAIVADHRKR
jgi:hypothetical protein